jgi:predicted nucleic acid-binding protein
MIVAFDTCTFVAYASGEEGQDVEFLDRALEEGSVMLPPVVLTEILSDSKLPTALVRFLRQVPLLEISDGYWERAGKLRATILGKRRKGSRLKARTADALVAQVCIDNDVPLITRDRDFRHFQKYSELQLL